MSGFRRLSAVTLPLLLIVLLSLGVAACGDDDDEGDGDPTGTASDDTGDADTGGAGDGGEVQVLGIWGDTELENFEAMTAPWEDDTSSSISFTGTRDITAQLNTLVEGGSPPDVAIPAEVGLFNRFATDGELVPLSECDGLEEMINEEYPEAFVDLGTVDGTLYGFFMKADTKGTIFYNPTFFTEGGYEVPTADSSWDDLIALSDQIKADGTPPWTMGQEAGAGTGFPGTDFIQQILLNEAGAETYDGIIDGSVPFTDAAMADAWQKFGQIALTEGYTSQGSADGIIATNFEDATFPLLETPPAAAMNYLGAFAGGILGAQFPDAVAGTDYDFFDFPGGGAATGGANIVYVFNMTDTVCSFLKYMASAEAQQIWVDLGGFTSVNVNVDTTSYPDSVALKAAEQLLDAPTFRFDLDDAIGGALQQAYFQGITAFLQNPDDLENILANIESAR